MPKENYEGLVIKRRKKRSTYTEQNAETFRPWFDECIKQGKELELPWDALDVSKNTMYIKASDALKWLCDEGNLPDAERNKYIIFRGNYKITPEPQGLVIRKRDAYVNIKASKIQGFIRPTAHQSIARNFRKLANTIVQTLDGINDEGLNIVQQKDDNNTAAAAVVQKEVVEETKVFNWKDKVEEFIKDTTNEDKEEIIEFEHITDEDKEWVCNILGNLPNVDFLFKEGNKLHMMKMKI